LIARGGCRKSRTEKIRSDQLYDPGKTVSEALIGLGNAGARLPDIQAAFTMSYSGPCWKS
jgi:hypothetical protein